MGLLMLVLVVCGLLVLLMPGEAASQSAPVTGHRKWLVGLLVALGISMLVLAGVLYLLAYAGAHDDVGVTWSNNAEARHLRTFGVLLGLGGLASLVVSRRLRRQR